MSVAVGTGHPEALSVPPAKSRNTAIGTRMPPAAAIAGCVALRAEFSSPLVNSYCSSTATTKKKIASRPSLIQ
jgi:hypothetical protein